MQLAIAHEVGASHASWPTFGLARRNRDFGAVQRLRYRVRHLPRGGLTARFLMSRMPR